LISVLIILIRRQNIIVFLLCLVKLVHNKLAEVISTFLATLPMELFALTGFILDLCFRKYKINVLYAYLTCNICVKIINKKKIIIIKFLVSEVFVIFYLLVFPFIMSC
jgi:hypothetical protein